MSQTTDQARGKTVGSSRGKKAGKAAPGSFRSDVPSPPRRRRPALTALAVLLIVGGAALAGLLAVRMDSREPVLVAGTDISTGQKITAAMLKQTNVSGDGLNTISVDQVDQIDGKLYARQTIYKGQLLQNNLLRKNPPLEVDQAQVGVPLSSGKYPPDLRSGDAVRLVRIGDTQSPSQALATGLVIKLTRGNSGGFGSDAKTSVATIIVPQSVSDQIVGATGTDSLALALTGRGVSVDDAEVTDLSGGNTGGTNNSNGSNNGTSNGGNN
jgi:hypothetical protein